VKSYLIKPITAMELLSSILNSLGAARPVVPMPVPATPTPTATAVSGLRVLLVEDNSVNQRLALALLQRDGHSVTVVDNGRAAIEALSATAFDAILMDVQMPEMSGLDATAEIRARERTTGGHVRIIAMTAHAMQGDRERCLAAGMDDYVTKPIRLPELRRAIQPVASAAACVAS
jgi:CheY-like chemotaxis protein